MSIDQVRVKKLHPDAVVPVFHSTGAAGFDLHATEDFVLPPIKVSQVPLEGEELLVAQDRYLNIFQGMLSDGSREMLVETFGGDETVPFRDALLKHIPDDVFTESKVKISSAVIDSGIAFELPVGYEMEVRGRSGLGIRDDIHVFHGTIDSDYRGSVSIKLYNLGDKPVSFTKGDRIAQGVISKVSQVEFLEVEDLSDTDRGAGGFGSTGL